MNISMILIFAIMAVWAYHHNKGVSPLIRDIENIAAKNGNLWKYSTDWRFQWALVLAPKRILSSADTAEMRAAKERLIAHRRVMNRNQLYAVLAVLAVFIGIIAFDVIKALITRN
jgi:hypothetical protein